MVERHKVVSFATVVALWTLVTNFSSKGNSHTSEVEIHNAILVAMLQKRSHFVKTFRPGHSGWSVHKF